MYCCPGGRPRGRRPRGVTYLAEAVVAPAGRGRLNSVKTQSGIKLAAANFVFAYGDFLIDSHPDFENVWLVGGGSGHGFKHGPALGEYVAGKVTQADADSEPRFVLSAEGKARRRLVY